MKISAIQMQSGNDLQANLSSAATLIKLAAQEGSQVAVLPEMFPFYGLDDQTKNSVQEKFNHGPIQDFLRHQAKDNNIWIIGGTIPIMTDDPTRSHAACLVYNNKGERVARYDKIHLFDVMIGKDVYAESNATQHGENIVVVDTPVGRVGLAVCYDIRFPELFRALANKGAEIFALPAAFTAKTGKPHWEILTRARAIENLCYFVGACQTGTQPNGREVYGHSLIIDPWGKIINLLPEEIGTVTAEIDLDDLRKIRREFPVLSHQIIQ